MSRIRSVTPVCVVGLALASLSLLVCVPDAAAVHVQVWRPILPDYQ